VWCFNFHREGGIYRGEWDLHRLGGVSLAPGRGRVAKPRGRLAGGAASTDSGFSSSCRHVATKAWAEPPQTLVGRPTPGTTRPGVWPTRSMCQIHPLGDDDFEIWSTSLCHPLKCSNLVPKFLKSNKHYNRGTRLVDKVNTWLFHTFTRHVGAWNRCFMSTNTSPKLKLLLILEQSQT
jgi:hypothetical protein